MAEGGSATVEKIEAATDSGISSFVSRSLVGLPLRAIHSSHRRCLHCSAVMMDSTA
jgi:hypothetical protein